MIEYLYLASCAECGCHKFKMPPCKTIIPICVPSCLYLGGLLQLLKSPASCIVSGGSQTCSLRSVISSWPSFLILLCVWMFCLEVSLCTTCRSGALGGQEKVLNPLELKLQMVVNRYIGARNRTQVRKEQLSPHPSISPPCRQFFKESLEVSELPSVLFQQATWGEAFHSGLRSHRGHQEASLLFASHLKLRVLLLWSSFKSKLYLPFLHSAWLSTPTHLPRQVVCPWFKLIFIYSPVTKVVSHK